MPATFSVPARATHLLAAAKKQRSERDAIADDQRSDALGPAHLVRGQGQHIGAQRGKIDRDTAGRLHRVAVKQRAMGMGEGRGRGDRLDDAGLIVRRHHRDHRRPVVGGECRLERGEIDHPIGVDRYQGRVGRRAQYRIMLDCRDDKAPAAAADKRQVVGLGAARGEHDLVRRRADQRRDALARVVDRATRRATEPMHRRGVAAELMSPGHGRRDGGLDRGAGVIVEVARCHLMTRRSAVPCPASP